uniref:Uncharacterized protein n=1 Tax=Arundo donax TaxID=35708 RepID=A0A0A9AF83_ARUDO
MHPTNAYEISLGFITNSHTFVPFY